MTEIRRSKLQIYIDILSAINKSNGKLKKTHIVYKANLTHKRLENYLDFLLQNELIIITKEKNVTYFQITKKGIDFLQEMRKLKEISDAFGMSLS